MKLTKNIIEINYQYLKVDSYLKKIKPKTRFMMHVHNLKGKQNDFIDQINKRIKNCC
jgi:hypothetical protein